MERPNPSRMARPNPSRMAAAEARAAAAADDQVGEPLERLSSAPPIPLFPRAAARVGLLYDERMCAHATPDGEDHPEKPERLRARQKLSAEGDASRCVALQAKEAKDKYIASDQKSPPSPSEVDEDEYLKKLYLEWVNYGKVSIVHELDIYEYDVEDLPPALHNAYLVHLREYKRKGQWSRTIKGYHDGVSRCWKHTTNPKQKKEVSESGVVCRIYNFYRGHRVDGLVKGVRMIEYGLELNGELLPKVLCKIEYSKEFIAYTGSRDPADDTKRKEKPAAANQDVSYSMIEILKRSIEERDAQIKHLQKELALLRIEHQKVLDEKNDASRKAQCAEDTNKSLMERIIDLEGRIRVFCRVRPSNDSTSSVSIENGKIALQHQEQKHFFEFNQIFNEDVKQSEVFKAISPLVSSAMEGHKVTIFSYGQSGSGKTHTMLGNLDLGNEDQQGIIPRTIVLVFQASTDKSKQGWVYQVKVSVVEIHNEIIQDLISSERSDATRVKIQHDENNMPIIRGLIWKDVNCSEQAISVLTEAIQRRCVGKTNINDESSRSHCIVTLSISGENMVTREKVDGVVNLVDLAGSENISLSGVEGVAQKETKMIMKSLCAFKSVIDAMAHKKAHIPFRDSKLTHLLMGSLSGRGRVVTIITISPEVEKWQQSMESLKFGEQASGCRIGFQVGSPLYPRQKIKK